MPVPESIKKTISQGLNDVNVPIRLAYIMEDPDFQTTNSSDLLWGDKLSKIRRMNLIILTDNGEEAMNNVLVFHNDGTSFTKLPEDGKKTLAIVAMIGKNKQAEACVVIAFINPDFYEEVYKKSNVTSVTKPTSSARSVSSGR